MDTILRTTSLFPLAALSLASLLVVGSSTQAATIQGFGALKFGMTPAEVAALKDCSSQTECLYDILGKNRYFTLGYGSVQDGSDVPTSSEATQTTLSHIDIEMGTYTQEWFLEVFEALAAQYSLQHHPTDDESALFREGRSQELVMGFAEGFVLLKVVRRPFGNIIMHVVYQDAVHAKAQRRAWAAAPVP